VIRVMRPNYIIKGKSKKITGKKNTSPKLNNRFSINTHRAIVSFDNGQWSASLEKHEQCQSFFILIVLYIYILKDLITPNLTWKLPKNNYDKILKIPLYTKPLKFNSKRHLNHCTVQNKLKSKKIPLTQVKCFSTVQQKLERVKFTSFNSIMTIVSHKKNHVAYHVH
jgi:hypothetical protein